MPKYDITKIYNDALYWVTSKQSKGKDYHLTRTQEAILRKLIHYSKKNPKITYSNKIISDHTFIDLEVVRKEIPKIVKKGFISSANITVSDGEEVYKRRTIYIKWDFIQMVLNEIPTKEEAIEVPQLEAEEFIEEDEPVESTKEIERVELTQEKIDWLLPLMQNYDIKNTLDDLLNLTQEQLVRAFYGGNGLWQVDDDTIENKQQWRLKSITAFKCDVYHVTNPEQRMNLNIHDLESYLMKKGMTFKDFDLSINNELEVNGLMTRKLRAS